MIPSWLQAKYLGSINEKFAKPAIDPEDAHAPLLRPEIFNNVFCFEETRKVSNDYVVQFGGESYQLLKQKRQKLPKPDSSVTVRRWLDDSVQVFWENRVLAISMISKPDKKEDETACLSV